MRSQSTLKLLHEEETVAGNDLERAWDVHQVDALSEWLSPHSRRPLACAKTRRQSRAPAASYGSEHEFSEGVWDKLVQVGTDRYIPRNGCYRRYKQQLRLAPRRALSHQSTNYQRPTASSDYRQLEDIVELQHVSRLARQRTCFVLSDSVHSTGQLNIVPPPSLPTVVLPALLRTKSHLSESGSRSSRHEVVIHGTFAVHKSLDGFTTEATVTKSSESNARVVKTHRDGIDTISTQTFSVQKLAHLPSRTISLPPLERLAPSLTHMFNSKRTTDAVTITKPSDRKVLPKSSPARQSSIPCQQKGLKPDDGSPPANMQLSGSGIQCRKKRQSPITKVIETKPMSKLASKPDFQTLFPAIRGKRINAT